MGAGADEMGVALRIRLPERVEVAPVLGFPDLPAVVRPVEHDPSRGGRHPARHVVLEYPVLDRRRLPRLWPPLGLRAECWCQAVRGGAGGLSHREGAAARWKGLVGVVCYRVTTTLQWAAGRSGYLQPSNANLSNRTVG